MKRIVLDLNQSAFAPTAFAASALSHTSIQKTFQVDPGYKFRMLRGSFGQVIALNAAAGAAIQIGGLYVAVIDSNANLLRVGLPTPPMGPFLGAGAGLTSVYQGDDDFFYPQDYGLLGGDGGTFGALIAADVRNTDAVNPHSIILFGNVIFELFRPDEVI